MDVLENSDKGERHGGGCSNIQVTRQRSRQYKPEYEQIEAGEEEDLTLI
jgi:hypothetical protein